MADMADQPLYRIAYVSDDAERFCYFTTKEDRDLSAVEMIADGWTSAIRVQSFMESSWHNDTSPDVDAPALTITLSARQLQWLKSSLDDAYAYRERTDDDSDDFENIDKSLRDRASTLYELFGFDPDYIGG